LTDILNRVELHSPDQARAVLKAHTLPWVGQQLEQGRQLVAEFRLLDDDITDKQRAYLHAVVLAEIALYARPGGQQFPMKVWKEHFRAEFLGFKVVTSINPLTGKKHRRRDGSARKTWASRPWPSTSTESLPTRQPSWAWWCPSPCRPSCGASASGTGRLLTRKPGK